jgi:cytochrome b6-f complex iron-sulfur subunit
MTDETKSEKKPFTRREFLNLAWLASLGFLTVNIAGITYLFSMPRFKEGEFGGVYTAGRVSDQPAVDSQPANHPKVKLWMANTAEGIVAIYKVCTHLGCLYGWNNQENKFICPCHGSQFEKDGEYITGPAPRSLDRFVIQIFSEDGELIAETDPNTGAPLPMPEDPNAQIRVDTGRRIQGKAHA